MNLISAIVFILLSAKIANANPPIFETLRKISSSSLFTPGVVINILKDSNFSWECMNGIRQYMTGIGKEEWAFQIFDAGTKFPLTGISSGSFVDLGDFDLCMDVSNGKTIFGKYCLGQLPLPLPDPKELNITNTRSRVPIPVTTDINGLATTPSMIFATCVPGSCLASEIEELYKLLEFPANFKEVLCQSMNAKHPITSGDIFTIAFFGIIIFITFLSTAYDTILIYKYKESPGGLINAFSLLRNTRKVLEINKPASISCIYGIRVISLMWVIVGHRTTVQYSVALRNYLDRYDWLVDIRNMVVLGGSVSVDSFFLLSGLLVSYVTLSSLSKGHKFNIIVFYIHRLARLTPSLLVVILIYLTVLKHLGNGPLWNIMIASMKNACDKYWWSTALYIQNYVNVDEMCAAHCWYLAANTHLYILSPFILLPFYKYRKLGFLISSALRILVVIGNFVTSWIFKLYGYFLPNVIKHGYVYNHYYYYGTHSRAAPWIIGVMLGYCIYLMVSTLLWIISLSTLIGCVFAGRNTLRNNYEYDRLANAFHLALLSPAWSLGLSWLIFACTIGHGGPINWFLSLPVFRFLSKLTYSMYLVHFGILMIFTGQTRSINFFQNLDTYYYVWGDFMFSFGAAVVLLLLFEAPVMAIEKCITGRTGKKLQRKSSKTISSNL